MFIKVNGTSFDAPVMRNVLTRITPVEISINLERHKLLRATFQKSIREDLFSLRLIVNFSKVNWALKSFLLDNFMIINDKADVVMNQLKLNIF